MRADAAAGAAGIGSRGREREAWSLHQHGRARERRRGGGVQGGWGSRGCPKGGATSRSGSAVSSLESLPLRCARANMSLARDDTAALYTK